MEKIIKSIIACFTGIIFVGVGIWILSMSGSNAKKLQEFNDNAEKVDAVVVDIYKDVHRTTGSKGKTRTRTKYKIYVSYKVDGKIYNNSYFTVNSNSYEKGEVVSVYYNKKNPSEVGISLYDVEGQKWGMRAMGIIFILMGAYASYITLKKNS